VVEGNHLDSFRLKRIVSRETSCEGLRLTVKCLEGSQPWRTQIELPPGKPAVKDSD